MRVFSIIVLAFTFMNYSCSNLKGGFKSKPVNDVSTVSKYFESKNYLEGDFEQWLVDLRPDLETQQNGRIEFCKFMLEHFQEEGNNSSNEQNERQFISGLDGEYGYLRKIYLEAKEKLKKANVSVNCELA